MKQFLIDLRFSLGRVWAIARPHRVRWKRLHDAAKAPVRAYAHDGAFDIHCVEEIHLKPGSHCNVGCGVAIQVGPGMSYDIRGRSGLNKIGIIAALGLVDAGYCNEIRVVLSNLSGEEYTVRPGDRVGQIKFVPVFDFQWEEVKEFKVKPGTRGMAGWGSSGR